MRKIKATFLYTDNTSLIVLSNCELRGKTNKQTNIYYIWKNHNSLMRPPKMLLVSSSQWLIYFLFRQISIFSSWTLMAPRRCLCSRKKKRKWEARVAWQMKPSLLSQHPRGEESRSLAFLWSQAAPDSAPISKGVKAWTWAEVPFEPPPPLPSAGAPVLLPGSWCKDSIWSHR